MTSYITEDAVVAVQVRKKSVDNKISDSLRDLGSKTGRMW